MKDLIKRIAKALVDHPEQVEVLEVEGEQVFVLDKEDIGKIIGKQGRTAHAIRAILGAASGKTKKRTVFEILDWYNIAPTDKRGVFYCRSCLLRFYALASFRSSSTIVCARLNKYVHLKAWFYQIQPTQDFVAA